MDKTVAIEVDIDRALDFLEDQFPEPEKRWGELRSLIAKQKGVVCTCKDRAFINDDMPGICGNCGKPFRR